MIFFLAAFSIQIIILDSLTIMNNQSSAPSVFSRAIEWISHHAIQPVKKIFAPPNTTMNSDPRKNMLQFSNIAHSQDQTRKLGLKHVRDRLGKSSEVDKKSRISNKLKKISHYWGKRLQDQQKPLELICPICMDFLVGSVSTKCGHTFCWQCIDEAVLFNPGCPVCRRQIQASDFTPCIELAAIVKRYLKKSNQNYCQNQISFSNRLEEFEQWLSLRLLRLSQIGPSDLVDIRDTQNIWCSGLIKQVIRVQGKVMLHIHFIGWSSIYDQIIPIQSQRLATYRLYSARKDIPHYQLPLENREIVQGYVVQQAVQYQNQVSSQEEDEFEEVQREQEQVVVMVEQKEEYECEMPSSKALNCFYNPQK